MIISAPRVRYRPPVQPLRSFATVGVATLLGLLIALPASLEAQYFGRNKVQYDNFDFQVLTTPHFDIHFYPSQTRAMEDVSRMAERWYERLARLFQHEFDSRKPLVFYADHPDFQQTNTISSTLSEGTGGVTESLKTRVIMPLTGSYASTDHVLGHELVHAFQYNIAQSRRGGGMQGLGGLPLWMIEGMAEYLSVGREDPITTMWLRDALLRDDFPTLRQMTRETRFFPYRFGQAFWTYVGGTYGDEMVVRLFRTALRVGWEPAIDQVLGISSDTLSVRWRASAEEMYRPLMESRTPPGEVGTLLLAPSTGAGRQNVAPAISPDGRHLLFMSEKDIFSVDLYVADARTGEVIRKLSSAASDPHFDALRFIDSSGAWSPDGERIVFVVFANGRNQFVIVDAEGGGVLDRIQVEDRIGEITSPSWSPDGRTLVFSGHVGGISDLFLLNLETRETTQLTDDRHADLQPVFSPDGRRIAFATDRGVKTDFDLLAYSEIQLALHDLDSRTTETLDIFGDVRHSNPQFTPDGRGLYFLSDADGFSDIYRLELENGDIQRVTEVATAVSGITAMSPAMSVARETGTVVFSVFDEFEFHVYSMDSRDLPQVRFLAETLDPTGRLLPPAEPEGLSRVMNYLDDPRTALAPPGSYDPAASPEYKSGLTLDWVGQPSVGVGTDPYGNYIGGSAAAFFSDMLGDRVLGVAVQAQGTVKDIGAQFIYQNLSNRWNWGVNGGHMPYLQVRTGGSRDAQGNTRYVQEHFRILQTQLAGLTSYPFSTTRRVDFSAGVTRYAFDLEQETIVFDRFGRLVDRSRVSMNEGLPDPLALFSASAALVGDNSFFGFTSPVRGGRYRVEVGQTLGTLNFNTLTVDWRRYFNPINELTFAIRGLHFGRYGSDVQESVLQPLFLGWESNVRGYSSYSFEPSRECIPSEEFGSCPQFDRLFGHRIGVVNAEARLPLIGTDRLGLFDFGFIPTELVAFVDGGVAWDENSSPVFDLSRDSLERIPVFSAGISSRFNVMGLLILEIFYAYPFQRPQKGAHWGFQLAPGW